MSLTPLLFDSCFFRMVSEFGKQTEPQKNIKKFWLIPGVLSIQTCYLFCKNSPPKRQFFSISYNLLLTFTSHICSQMPALASPKTLYKHFKGRFCFEKSECFSVIGSFEKSIFTTAAWRTCLFRVCVNNVSGFLESFSILCSPKDKIQQHERFVQTNGYCFCHISHCLDVRVLSSAPNKGNNQNWHLLTANDFLLYLMKKIAKFP